MDLKQALNIALNDISFREPQTREERERNAIVNKTLTDAIETLEAIKRSHLKIDTKNKNIGIWCKDNTQFYQTVRMLNEKK